MAWGNVGVLETAATMTTAMMAITKPVIYMEGWGSKKWIQVVVGRWKGGCINMCLQPWYFKVMHLCIIYGVAWFLRTYLCVLVCVCMCISVFVRTYIRRCAVYK